MKKEKEKFEKREKQNKLCKNKKMQKIRKVVSKNTFIENSTHKIIESRKSITEKLYLGFC